MIKEDAFIEHCEVHSNYYGTAKGSILKFRQNKMIPILDIDVQGALKFYKFKPESHFIAIMPPTWETLRQRLEKRGTETPESIEKRTKNAL